MGGGLSLADVPVDVNRAQHRMAGTNQHPISMGTKYITRRMRGWQRAAKCARSGPISVKADGRKRRTC